MPLRRLEFSLALATGMIDGLRTKRDEYLARIKGPDNTWDSSWKTRDLLTRHDSDADFRLDYYKLVLICTVIMACEKNADRVKRNETDLETTISTWYIGFDLTGTLGRPVHPEEFNTACDVIGGYIDNSRSLT